MSAQGFPGPVPWLEPVVYADSLIVTPSPQPVKARLSREPSADPHLLALAVLTSGICGGAWPARQGARGFVLSGCGGADRGPLIGHAIGPTRHPRYFEFPAAAEVAAPDPGTCWVMTKIVVHYHVGIRHYSTSDPYQLVICSDASQVNSAMSAAEAAD